MTTFALDARSATDHFPGIGRYVSNLARAIPSLLAADETLLLISRPGVQARWPLPAADGERVRRVEAAVSHFSPAQQWMIPRLLHREGAALYHSPYYMMPVFPALPLLLTSYDLIPLRRPETATGRVRRFFTLFHGLAARRAQRIIAISQATADDLTALLGVPPAKIAVIPLAPDPRFTPPEAGAGLSLRQKYGLKGPYVLYLGINKPHKNLPRLLEAWERVRTTARLVIAGAWDERFPEAAQIAGRPSLRERIRLLGPVDEADLPALYGEAELFVFPSLYEGFGLPVIEAMACGTPVACSYHASLPEVGGLAAAYFNPLDPADIAATLQQLLDLPERRREAVEAGLKRAKRFSWEQTAAATLAVYRAMVLND